MSGIYGLWNGEGQPISVPMVDAMAQAIAHRGPDGDARWVGTNVALGCQLTRVTPDSFNDVQPGSDELGNRIVFDGRIDNGGELKALLGLGAHARETELLLAAFRRYGETFAAHLNGEFVLALHDARGQRLLVARDPVGTRPLYYTETREGIALASEIKSLFPALSSQPKPNLPYLSVQLMGGVPPYRAGMTFFEGIAGLHPGYTLVCERGKSARLVQHWDFDVEKAVRFKRDADYVDAFRELFVNAVRRRIRTREPVVVALSGGLDSSSAFCVAQQLIQRESGLAPEVIGLYLDSPKGSSADEREYIETIERDYGVTVERLPHTFMGVVAGITRTTAAYEAPIADAQWRNNELMFGRVRDHGSRVLLNGQFGDQIMFNGAYLTDMLCGLRIPTLVKHLRLLPRYIGDTRWKHFRFIARDAAKWLFPEFARPLLMTYRKRTAPLLRERRWYSQTFREEARRAWPVYRPAKQRFMSRSANMRYFEARAQYFIQTFELLNKYAASYGVEYPTPYLDRDLMQFLMQVPGEKIGLDAIPRGIIRRAMEGILPTEIVHRHTKGDFTSIQNDTVWRHYHEIVNWFANRNILIEEG